MSDKPTTGREALTRASAATYLDMSVDTFDTVVRPCVPFIDLAGPDSLRPVLRWLKADVDTYLAARRRAA